MTTNFDKELIDLEQEITNLKQSKLKWAGTIATTDWRSSFTFTITEIEYGLFSSKALEITATNANGDSFLSELMFSGSWDGRGWAHGKVYESKGKTKWQLAMVTAREDDYTHYYSGGGAFDVSLGVVIRTTSAVNITTKWVDNPYTRVW